jgi:glycosyltransferase involved in cell wall biosynthesis
MSTTVSVILPTYNRKHSLVEAIRSVLSQSYEDLELIVVDDASTEDIPGVISGFSDERLRYVRRKKNGGAAAARNTGLAEARGRLIAFQDSDDIWLPGKLLKQVRLLSDLPSHVGAVTGSKILHGRDASFNYGPTKIAYAPPPESPLRIDEDQLDHLLRENRISLQNALFRRDCMAGSDWFDTCARANEDWEFAIRLVQHTTVYEYSDPVVLGFVSPDSISSSARRQLMGMLRIMRRNRMILAARKKHRSMMRIDLAITLHNAGKNDRARRFMLAGLRDHPLHMGMVMFRATRRLLSAVGSRRSPAKARPSGPGTEPGQAILQEI